MINKRIDYIDIMKGIGIILVVLAHRNLNSELRKFIYCFHMPLFFFISGYLFKYNKKTKTIYILKKKFKMLIIPYFCFVGISGLIQIVLMKISRVHYESTHKTISEILILNGKTIWNTPLWFLVCLFFAEIIYFLINKISSRIPLWISVSMVTILSFVCTSYNLLSIFKINVALASIIFLFGGHLLKILEKKGDLRLSRGMTYALSFGLLILTFFLGVYKNGRVDMYNSLYGNYIMFIIVAFMGTMAIYLISKELNKVLSLEFLGRNSLIIMSLQYILFWMIDVFSKHILKIHMNLNQVSNIRAIIITIVTIILFIPIINIINKYLPWMLGKSKSINDNLQETNKAV